MMHSTTLISKEFTCYRSEDGENKHRIAIRIIEGNL
jgi:hypothetical protein